MEIAVSEQKRSNQVLVLLILKAFEKKTCFFTWLGTSAIIYHETSDGMFNVVDDEIEAGARSNGI